jgi:hypothetical protein
MLKKLQNIRKLLTAANPENIHAAVSELEKMAAAVANLSKTLSAKHEVTRADVDYLAELKAELSTVLMLSRAALDYYHRLGGFLLAAFAAYEHTGQFRPLDVPPRVIAQL